jgi:hypothetical protein
VRARFLVIGTVGFVVALGMQFVLHDIPGGWVPVLVAPIVAGVSIRLGSAHPFRHRASLGALAACTAGFFVGSCLEEQGNAFTGLGIIAAMYAVGLLLVADLIYGLINGIVWCGFKGDRP